MAANLAVEFQGYIKFMARASSELISWFAPHCKDDPVRITFYTAREWDGMDDMERKSFIRAKQLESKSNLSGTSSFICYKLLRHYSQLPNQLSRHEVRPQIGFNTIGSEDSRQIFNPKFARSHGDDWRSMTEEERQKYSNIKLSDISMDHILRNRSKLHEMYSPKELSALEFILKTKPRYPLSSRMWFYREHNLSLKSTDAEQRWLDLSEEERETYEKCALLDKKRYSFEKVAWLTKLLTVDFEEDNFTLDNFVISGVKSRLDDLGSMLELSRLTDKPAHITLKRPRGAFSLWIEEYRYRIRDERPEFQFARHLRECSESWSKLSEEEKQVFKDASKKLREDRKKLIEKEFKKTADSLATTPADLFKPLKSLHGPCRPSHLIPRVPSATTLWAKENNIPSRNRQAAWNELSADERARYESQREQIKTQIELKRHELDKKLDYVRDLVRKSKELSETKRKLRLIGPTRRPLRNLYTKSDRPVA